MNRHYTTISYHFIKRLSIFSNIWKLHRVLVYPQAVHSQNLYLHNYKNDPNMTSQESLIIKGWVKKIEIEPASQHLFVSLHGFTSKIAKVIVLPEVLSSTIPQEAAVIISGREIKEAAMLTVIANEIQVKTSKHLCRSFLKKLYSDHLLQDCNLHLRPKIDTYCVLFSLRSKVKKLFRQYLYENNYIEVDLPLLTSTVIDGSYRSLLVKKRTLAYGYQPLTSACGQPFYISPSGQLHLFSFTSALRKVFALRPGVRTNYKGGKYLYEFWTLSITEVFCGNKEKSLAILIVKVETLLKHLLRSLNVYFASEKNQDAVNRIQVYLQREWKKVTYADVVNFVKETESEKPLHVPFYFGSPLSRNVQERIMDKFGGPLFVIRHPPNLKEFNIALSENSEETLSFEVIFPGVGSVVTGGVWEDDSHRLLKSLENSGGSRESLSWLTDTFQWGVAPTRGFRLGIDRFISVLFPGDIKRVTAFPRNGRFCQ